MSGTSMYKVRGDEYGKIADNDVIAILKKELPAALQRMGLNKPLSEAELDDFAYYLLDYAKACDRNTLDQIQETKTIQIAKQPTPQQCKDLQEFLEQIVRISVVSKNYQVNKHLIKNTIGKIWSIIQSEEREKAIYENEMRTPNAVVGDRG